SRDWSADVCSSDLSTSGICSCCTGPHGSGASRAFTTAARNPCSSPVSPASRATIRDSGRSEGSRSRTSRNTTNASLANKEPREMSEPSPQIELIARPGLMTPSVSYKPFRYPWAIEYWRRQQQIHWLPEEVPLGEDCKDWATRLTDAERNLLTQVFRFFTQSDVEVQDNYHERYARVFR